MSEDGAGHTARGPHQERGWPHASGGRARRCGCWRGLETPTITTPAKDMPLTRAQPSTRQQRRGCTCSWTQQPPGAGARSSRFQACTALQGRRQARPRAACLPACTGQASSRLIRCQPEVTERTQGGGAEGGMKQGDEEHSGATPPARPPPHPRVEGWVGARLLGIAAKGEGKGSAAPPAAAQGCRAGHRPPLAAQAAATRRQPACPGGMCNGRRRRM